MEASKRVLNTFCSSAPFFVCIVWFSPNTLNPQTIWCALVVLHKSVARDLGQHHCFFTRPAPCSSICNLDLFWSIL
jgi:hypothetical protein